MLNTTAAAPDSGSGLWWRNKWMECIYSADDLKPLEVLIAAIYADHAHDKRTAWVVGTRLMERSKLSRDGAFRALKGLEDKGYLIALERKSRRPTTYALVIPEHRLSPPHGLATSTGDGLAESSVVRETDQLVRETDFGSPPGGLHPSTYPSSSSHESAPLDEEDFASTEDDDSHNAMMAAHQCDYGWINNPDNTVTRCQHPDHKRSAA